MYDRLKRRYLISLLLSPLSLSVSCQKPAAGPPVTTAETESRERLSLNHIRPTPQLPEDVAQPAFEPAEQALRYLHTGQARFDERLWADATTALEKALQIEPRLADARILLARAALQQGNSSLAESHLKEAMKLRPRDPAVHRLLGEIAFQARRYDDAIVSFRTALLAGTPTPSSPDVVLAHLSLALALKEAGYLAAAADELQTYANATAKPTEEMSRYPELKEAMLLYRGKIAVTMGEIHMKLGIYDRAVTDYELAVTNNPEDRGLLVRLSQALAHAGRSAEALERVRKILRDRPDDEQSLGLIKEICELSRDPNCFEAELVKLAQQVQSPEIQMRVAKMLLDRKKLDEAKAVLTRLTNDQPEEIDAAYLLARLSFEQGEFRSGLDQIARTVRGHPNLCRAADELLKKCSLEEIRKWASDKENDAVAQYLVAIGEYRQSDFADAEKSARQSLQRDEKFVPARSLLAALALRDHRWEEAKSLAQSAIDGGLDDARTYLIKGAALDALDQFQEAETALLESFRLDRKSAEPLFVLAKSAERRGEALRSEQTYRRIVDDVDPRHMQARERLVRLLLHANKFDKAKEYDSDFERLGLSGPEVERCRALMDLVSNRAPSGPRRLNEYREALDKIVQKYPDDPATYVERAMSYEAEDKFAEAIKETQTALRLDPDNYLALERKVHCQRKLLDFDGASQTTAVLLKLRPRDAELLQRMAELAWSRADFDDAVARFKALLARDDLKDRREMYVARLLGLLRFTKRGAEAAQVAKDWLDLAPTDAVRRDVYLDALQSADRRDEAVELARQWLSADPTNTGLRVQYIEQFIAAKRYVEGQQRVLGWLASDADDLDLNRLLFRIFWAAKQWNSAIDLAQTGMEIAEQRGVYEALLGASYRLARRYDDAIEFYRERSSGPAAVRTLIEVLIEAERFGEAEKLATSQLSPRANPTGGADLATVYVMRNYLVRIYQLAGRENQAAQQLEEILKILPADSRNPGAAFFDRYVGIQNDLGYTWADAGTHLEEAEKMIRFALSEQPTRGAYVDSLGWVLYKRGKFDESVAYLRRAIRLMENEDAVLYDHLADALYRAGKIDEAKSNWEKALAVRSADDDPPNAEDRRVLARIKSKLDSLVNKKKVWIAPIAGEKSSSQPAEQSEKDKDEPSDASDDSDLPRE